MGIRCTQLIGLTTEAENFLRQNVKTKKINCSCPDCKTLHVKEEMSREYQDASGLGMFDDGPMLMEYTLKDGSIVREIHQNTVWSSGPMIYLCLEKENGEKIFMWPDEEIG